ncbi:MULTISPECIES: fimbrial biogenesis chaperone [unclassified Brenneria]|uniref:fimbrial biogenesis chaperone n=1 Tax=unclassified Brenneria TaxID=2634434 RepID=UPI00155266AF|nr:MULTISPECIES: fimbria/pilus periplasmic chaperone [unclassified Brenneria]MBJ7223712.1 molecular chaperone [Brenneria sp. L3-3C-1]MEE3644954.1 fimbria/pilus periplasmic chaperone [Brenneria sp. L3_3C_1]MEE3652296.1 fimbria/pilus periplasmic chaperone [Brenneria sp. HEZEL_4_2_4]NPD02253.1 molecular chaperone [Brenneria sp. hezel4-2-4]
MIAGLWCIALQTFAQALSIVPISQTLSANKRAASFTLTNHSDKNTQVQIRSYAWTQTVNSDTYQDTTRLSISPPFATIAPGQSQTIRLLLRESAGQTEEAYRVIFDQIPDNNRNKVELALRFTIPVFSQPQALSTADIRWRVEKRQDQAVLIAVNHGQQHAMLTNISLNTDGNIALKLKGPGLPYILAGSERHWLIDDRLHRLTPGRRLHLKNASPTSHADQWLNVGITD